jgi:hypothetical protein
LQSGLTEVESVLCVNWRPFFSPHPTLVQQ